MNMELFKEFLRRAGYGVGQFIKATLISSLVSFIVILIGLKMANVPYYGLLAFVIGIVDVLPFIGAGFVLLPWAIITLIQGNINLAASLVIIYIITFVLKQILEPLILGKSIGLKPLYTLGITILSMVALGPAVGAIVGAMVSILIAVYIDMKRSGLFDDKLIQ